MPGADDEDPSLPEGELEIFFQSDRDGGEDLWTSSRLDDRGEWNPPSRLSISSEFRDLDPAISVGIMKLLDRINRADTTVLMATHDSTIVDQMRKRVIELDDGEVVRDQSRGVYGYQ